LSLPLDSSQMPTTDVTKIYRYSY